MSFKNLAKKKQANYINCTQCNKSFHRYPKDQKRYINSFCSLKCSSLFQKGKEIKESTRKKLSISVKKWIAEHPYEKNTVEENCPICHKTFQRLTYRDTKTCGSDKCVSKLMSQKRMATILEKGTSNMMTKQMQKFSYKTIKDIDTDSKLERAAIIYLVDNFKATEITRCDEVIKYTDNTGKERLFNPDFVVMKNKTKYIVEVKMNRGKSDHVYNIYIPFKKDNLKKYCIENKCEMIWLDFEYDKEFRKIYRKHLQSYNN